MREIFGDLWQFWAPGKVWLVITTNGFVNAEGRCTMGRGTAEQAARRFPSLPRELGTLIKKFGNRVFLWPEYGIITVPVKDVWYRPAYLPRILHSLRQALELLKEDPRPVFGVRFGCGNGGLDWEEVRPEVKKLLDDRFTIVEGCEETSGLPQPESMILPFDDIQKGRVVFGGSRSIQYLTVEWVNRVVVRSGFDVREVVDGEDRYGNSPDMVCKAWADAHGIPYKPMRADWRDLSHPDCDRRRRRDGTEYDHNAGFRRNRKMAEYAGPHGAYISFWDGSSGGTRNMLQEARRHGLRLCLELLKPGRNNVSDRQYRTRTKNHDRR